MIGRYHDSSPAILPSPNSCARAFFLILLLAAAVPAAGTPCLQNPGLTLHIAPVTQNPCGLSLPAPWDVDAGEPTLSTPSGPFYYVFLIACGHTCDDTVGIAGVECGIDYSGGYAPEGGASPISVFAWQRCGDLEFPSTGWPAPGGGNLITWQRAHCQINSWGYNWIYGVAGYFYMGAYAPAEMRVIARPVSGSAKLADCFAAESEIVPHPFLRLGTARFGSANYGYNACMPIIDPVQPSTWSGIKSLIKRGN